MGIRKHVCIIGAGFTGLAAAWKLSQKGFKVTVLEAGFSPGGLAAGFKEQDWKWTLEHHYHHLFISDNAILKLAKEVGHKVIFKRPKTSIFINGKINQLDDPISLLFFRQLPIIDRIRTGFVLLLLKINPYWQLLEGVTAKKFIVTIMGERVWKVLWEPLLAKKFGRFHSKISASWFWARIKKRSSSLGYPEKGFLAFAEKIEKVIKKRDGNFSYQTIVKRLAQKENGILVTDDKGTKNLFDYVVCTLPTSQFLKLMGKRQPVKGKKRIGLGAVNLVVILSRKFLTENTYWLSINDLNYPFLAIVEHTNFISKKNYGAQHVIYIGNYLEKSHRYFKMDAQAIFNEFLPFLQRINMFFNAEWVLDIKVFKSNFAQPIVYKNYSKNIPPLAISKRIYLANIEQVYPWDRGTNYSVELGNKAAEHIINDIER